MFYQNPNQNKKSQLFNRVQNLIDLFATDMKKNSVHETSLKVTVLSTVIIFNVEFI